ncbi:MAG: epoxyqueuosine reductase QueH [Patescibacteria group bacterium]
MQKLLLHACCGVCSAYVPERLMPDFDVTVYYENSNIYPSDEFHRRQEAARIMAQGFGLPFIEPDYNPKDWFKAVRGLRAEPERGKRCDACFLHRLDKTFAYAKTHGFTAVATTLSVSRRKNVDQINAIGYALADQYGIEFIGKDWKKGNGENISQQRARDAGIYRQNYCGCVYSKLTPPQPSS